MDARSSHFEGEINEYNATSIVHSKSFWVITTNRYSVLRGNKSSLHALTRQFISEILPGDLTITVSDTNDISFKNSWK